MNLNVKQLDGCESTVEIAEWWQQLLSHTSLLDRFSQVKMYLRNGVILRISIIFTAKWKQPHRLKK